MDLGALARTIIFRMGKVPTEGEARARLWAVDLIDGRVTLVRFIWDEQRSAYLRNRLTTARAVVDIKEYGTDNKLYDVQRNKRV